MHVSFKSNLASSYEKMPKMVVFKIIALDKIIIIYQTKLSRDS